MEFLHQIGKQMAELYFYRDLDFDFSMTKNVT
jgi:hypothetical protein